MTDMNDVDRHLTLTRQTLTPSAASMDRVLAKLEVDALALGATGRVVRPSADPPSAWRALRASGVVGVAVGVGLVALGFIAGSLADARRDAPPPPLPVAQAARVADEPASRGDVLVAEDPAEPETPRAPSHVPPRRRVSLAPASTSAEHAAVAPASERARDELTLLQRAERAVRAGNAELALALTREHETRHPTSALEEERRAIELMAHCQAGETDASARAAHFLRQYPESVYVERIGELCTRVAPELGTAADKLPGAGH